MLCSPITENAFVDLARVIAQWHALRLRLTYDEQQDCVQEFLLKWLPFPQGFPLLAWPDRERRAFLHRCAQNHCSNFRRALCARSQREVCGNVSEYLYDPDPAHSPEALLFQHLFWEEVGCISERLSPEGWNLFVAHHLEGEKVVHIAERTPQRTAHALRQTLLYLRKRLRVLCLEYGVTEATLRTYLPLYLSLLSSAACWAREATEDANE